MTPLSDALTAAQRSALAALEKAYVNGQIVDVHFVDSLNAVGISDPVDIAFLMASLDVLRQWGVAAPTMTEKVVEANHEPASEKQIAYLTKLCKEKNQALPDPMRLTKAEASEAIDQLQNGTYDAGEWYVPF